MWLCRKGSCGWGPCLWASLQIQQPLARNRALLVCNMTSLKFFSMLPFGVQCPAACFSAPELRQDSNGLKTRLANLIRMLPQKQTARQSQVHIVRNSCHCSLVKGVRRRRTSTACTAKSLASSSLFVSMLTCLNHKIDFIIKSYLQISRRHSYMRAPPCHSCSTPFWYEPLGSVLKKAHKEEQILQGGDQDSWPHSAPVSGLLSH